jgi:hypothetical protein
MKRTMRFLTRLYPSRWRKRYGAELEALLEDATPSARDAFDVFGAALKMQMTAWGFGRITLACTVAGTLMAAAISFAFPVHYASQTVLYVMPPAGSTLAGKSADRMVNNLEWNIFSRESLTSIILEHDLYPRERARMPLHDVIREMRRNIRVAPIPPASPENEDARAFVVQFDYRDPCVAQQVNIELTSRFIEGNLEAARRLNSHSIFRVMRPPSLPLRPAGPNRTQFAAVGLFAGLLASLTVAIVVRSHCGMTSQDG